MFRWGLGQLTTFRGENYSKSQEGRTEDALRRQGLEAGMSSGLCRGKPEPPIEQIHSQKLS